MRNIQLIGLCLVVLFMSRHTQANQITSMTITDGSYTFNAFGLTTSMPLEQIANVDLIAGYYPANWNLGVDQPTCTAGALFCHDFGGDPTYFNYFTDATGNVNGFPFGGDVPSGTIDLSTSTIAVDFMP